MRLMPTIASSLLVLLSSCTKDDFATVTIEYPRSARQGQLSLERSHKQRVSEAFNSVAREQGYECRPHRKRLDEIRCKGPKEMNILFQPDLNQPRYIATLNWLEVGDRSREEFDAHVAEFVQSMDGAIADPAVVITVANERIE